jgi:hypothetical protein
MGTFKKDILWHITNKSGRGVYSLLKYPFVLTALVPCLLDFDLWQCLSLEETLFFGTGKVKTDLGNSAIKQGCF